METKEAVHHSSIKSYLLVFLGLGILTAATVGLSYLGLAHTTAIALAALIAMVKCTLIAIFFMHLRFENKWIYALVLSGIFLVAVLIWGLLPDIGFPLK